MERQALQSVVYYYTRTHTQHIQIGLFELELCAVRIGELVLLWQQQHEQQQNSVLWPVHHISRDCTPFCKTSERKIHERTIFFLVFVYVGEGRGWVEERYVCTATTAILCNT